VLFPRVLLAVPSLAVACAGLRLPGADPPDGGPPPGALGGMEERMPAPPRKPATTYIPGEPARTSYVAPPLKPQRPTRAGRRSRQSADELTEQLIEAAVETARAAGLPAPISDDRFNALARDIARLSRVQRAPPSEVLRFLTAHYGIVDSDPQILTLVGPNDADSTVRRFRQDLPRAFRSEAPGHWNRIGVGTHVEGFQLTTALLLWEQKLELAPVPRQLPASKGAMIRGRFLRKFDKPQLVFTMPNGSVRALLMSRRGDQFEGEFRCSFGDGRYQVEMVAADASGPMVLANFPLFCGVSPPADVAAHDEEDPQDLDPARAEQELFALINNDRRAAGLLPLVWDNRLAAIARAHSRDMSENRFIGHVSPTKGDTETRVQLAGVRHELLTENVGRERGVLQVHEGLMQSPGHRANVLNPQLVFVGVGVVVETHPGGGPLVVTELFAK
jgi:uncharacterized protein YkwD